MNRRTGLAAVGLLVLGGLGVRAWRALDRANRVQAACDATDPQAAIGTSDGLVEELGGGDPLLPLAVDCRCDAFLAAGRGADCAALVTATLDRVGDDWVDLPTLDRLSGHLLRAGAAVALDRLYAGAAPRLGLDAAHLGTWWKALRMLGGGPHILATFAPAVRALPAAETLDLRIGIAQKLTKERMFPEARAALDPAPDPTAPDSDRWYRALADVVAGSGDQLELTRVMKDWESKGGDPRYIYLVYGVVSSLNHLEDGATSNLEILRAAVRAAPDDCPLEDRRLGWVRLLFDEVNAGNGGGVRALAAEAKARGVDLDEAMLAQFEHPERPGEETGTSATLKLPGSAAGGAVTTLVFGPDADASAETAPVADELSLPVASAAHPSRWVVRDRDGAVLASGTTADATVVTVVAHPPVAPPPPADLTRAPADGHRQVFVVIGDCMDWHLLRYLQARGDLPVISALEPVSVAGVLTSAPAFTGVAMEKIAHPAVVSDITVAQYAYSLGVELQGLESVGFNPLSGLKWVLPESPYLTDLVGGGPLRALNLLFSHGDIEAGRNAEVVGPYGQRTQLSLTTSRLLTDDEMDAIAAGAPRVELPLAFLQEMAAEFDEATRAVKAGDVDLLLLRVEQTDLLTHSGFATLVLTAQDDGRSPLYASYRYVDRRLGDIIRASDGDDVVLFMSDHGIENSLVHSPDAVFMAYGLGKAGRLTDRPELAGLPRALTRWLSIAPDPRWPASRLDDEVTP